MPQITEEPRSHFDRDGNLKSRKEVVIVVFPFCERKSGSCGKAIHPVLFTFADE
jgi:hypothetical protein